MERMLTEVLWRVNVGATHKHRILPIYGQQSTFLRAARQLNLMGIVGCGYTHPPDFCKRACKVMKTKDRPWKKGLKSAKSPQVLKNKGVRG
jgi:hypothetical protein